MSYDGDTPVGTLAAEHPLATRVFHRYQIDFCCGGGRPLKEACEARGLEVDTLLEEIRQELESGSDAGERWDTAPLDELVDHIEAAYHAPLREELPRLEAMARKVNEVHGSKDPERLGELVRVFVALRAELVDHMMKEEEILFPMVRRGEGSMADGPIQVMEEEHDAAGNALRRLRELTDDFQPPEGACNTWRALWKGLEALEGEMHQHIHLENNILFPRAMQEQ